MRLSTILPRLLAVLACAFTASTAAADGFTVSGRVLTEEGEPLPGARVAVTETRAGYAMGLRWLEGRADPETVAEGVTGADGWYHLELRRPGRWRTIVSAAGHVPMERWLEPFLGEERLATVTLPKDAGLQVTVVDERGEPVPGARVWNQPAAGSRRWQEQREAGWKPPFATALADEHGRLRLPRLEGEGLRIRAWHPERLASPEVTSHGEPVRLTLPPGVPAAIEVRNGRGRPAPGAVVRWGEIGWTAGRTGDDGRATLALPAEGRTRILAQTADGSWGEAGVATPLAPETVPVVRLAAPPTVHGRVVDADTGAAVAGAFVYRAGGSQTVVSDRTGSFELWLPAATSRPQSISAAAPGYREGGERVDPTAPPREVHLALSAARRVAGRVVTESGKPVIGAAVWVRPARIVSPRDMAPAAGPQSTDAAGGFTFAALPRDRALEVRVRAEGLAPAELAIAPEAPSTGLVVELGSGASLTARVVTASGAPVPGARMSLRPGDASDPMARLVAAARERTEPPPEGRSDEEGHLRLALLPAGTFVALVEAAGHPDRVLRNLEIPEDGEVDLEVVVLQEAASIPGVVVDPEGRPVAGAEVQVAEGLPLARPGATRPTATTGEDGAFELAELPAGGRFRLEATAPGWISGSVADVPAPPDEPVEVVLERGGRLFGVVVDGEGRPVSDRLLVVQPADGSFDPFRVRHEPRPTDDQGGFDVGELPAGEYLLRVYPAQSYASGGEASLEHGPFALAAGQQIGPLRLVVDESAAAERVLVEGVVARPSGLPAIGARVHLRSGQRSMATVTDSAGRFELRADWEGPATLEARHAEHGRAEREVTLSHGLAPLRLELVPGAKVSGRVVDPEGNPVADASVVVSPVESEDARPGLSVRSDADGAFAVGALDAGAYDIAVSARGWLRWHTPEPFSLDADETREVPVELARGAVLSGRIVGLEPHELAAVEVAATSLEAASPRRRRYVPATVDHRGTYRAEGLAPGRWSVRAQLSQPARQAAGEVTVAPGQRQAELDLAFEDGYAVSVTVLGRGEPLTATLTLRGGAAALHGQTDAQGRFRFADLAAGEYELEIRLGEVRRWRRVSFDGDAEVVVDLPLSEVTGQLVDPFGDAVAGADVVLLLQDPSAGGFSAASTVSSPDGRFRLRQVPEGPYRLSVRKDRAARVEPVEVTGPRVDLGILQLTEEGVVELVLRGPDGPLSDRVVVAWLDAHGRPVFAGPQTAGPDGLVALTGVPAEVRSMAVVTFSSGGRLAPAEVPVTVGDGTAPPIPVTLPLAGELRLRVPTELVPGARVGLADPAGRPPLPLRLEGRRDVLVEHTVTTIHLPPGRWLAVLTARDGRAWSAEVSLQPGQTAELALGGP